MSAKKIKRYLLTALILAAALVGTVFWGRSKTEGISSATVPVKQKGPVAAPLSMIVYSDFQCPACRKAREPIEALVKKFPDQLKVEFRHFPIEEHHRWALLAAQFAECAGRKGKFWPYHDRLYEEQPAWSQSADPVPLFVGYAREMGLNLQELETCVTGEQMVEEIRKERKEGERAGVRSTPTMFINEKIFVGSPQLEEQGEQFIQEELKKKPAAGNEPQAQNSFVSKWQ